MSDNRQSRIRRANEYQEYQDAARSEADERLARARQTAYEFWRTLIPQIQFISLEGRAAAIQGLADLLRAERLEEARWWRNREPECYRGVGCDCDICERIRALEGERSKP